VVRSYHGVPFTAYKKGELGQLSKLLEEIEEAIEAQEQINPVLVLCELADLMGALEAYLTEHHPTISIEALTTMAAATARAFKSGERK